VAAISAQSNKAFDIKDFVINVIGKVHHTPYKFPPELSHVIQMHTRIPYNEYYGIISKSYALLPMLASENYYTSK
jgi:hypothetical protein